MSEFLVLVDGDDRTVGSMEKVAAHANGLLHRAFSVIVFNDDGEMLLQRRADEKYHSGGLWSNTCCGHPRPDEQIAAAARRRLMEEMGFECDLQRIGSFRYMAQLDNGLTEHEIDHVFVGTFDGPVAPNPEEVGEYRWINVSDLRRHIIDHPRDYTFWFKRIWELYSPALSRFSSQGVDNAG